MANSKTIQMFRTLRRRVDPAKSDIAAGGRASASRMHNAGIGDTSVSPLTPTSTQAMIFLQTATAAERRKSSIHYEMTFQES